MESARSTTRPAKTISYASYMPRPRSRVRRAEDQIVASWLREIVIDVPSDQLIVDLGRRIGFALDHMIISPKTYIGMGGFDAVESARLRFPRHTFEIGPLEALEGIQTGSAGLVMALFDSLGLARPEPTMREVRRVLAPGGKLFLMARTPRNAEPGSVTYRTADLQSMTIDFEKVEVRGLSRLTAFVPESIPQGLLDRMVSADIETMGRWFPDGASFLVLTAERPQPAPIVWTRRSGPRCFN